MFLKKISWVALAVLLSKTSFAGRTATTTNIRQRVEQTGANQTVKGASTRVFVELKNLSEIVQHVGIDLINPSRTDEVVFESSAYNSGLSNWLLNSTMPEIRYRTYSTSAQHRDVILAAGGSASIPLAISCIYTNTTNPTCDVDEIPLALAGLINHTIKGIVTSAAGITINVLEDRGAILGDIMLQDVVAGRDYNSSFQVSRPINGGRPF